MLAAHSSHGRAQEVFAEFDENDKKCGVATGSCGQKCPVSDYAQEICPGCRLPSEVQARSQCAPDQALNTGLHTHSPQSWPVSVYDRDVISLDDNIQLR